MPLTNQEIEDKVSEIVRFCLKDTKIKTADERIIVAGTALITNLLQNINDIGAASADLKESDG